MTKLIRMLGSILKVLVATVLLVLIIAWMSGYFHEKVPPGTDKMERRMAGDAPIAKVVLLPTVQHVDAVGTVEPRRKTDVASRMLATINELTVNPGDAVKVGQLLCVLDDREIQAQLREAEAASAGIEADLVVRQREYERYKKMFADRAVTKEDLDRIEGAFQVTQAQLQRMREQANRIEVMLTYAQIKAQTAGIVADRYMDPGDLAVPGKPILTIHNPKQLELNANVRDVLAGRVHVGMQLPVTIDALNRHMMGTVREIVPRSQANSRSLLVKLTLPDDKLAGIYIGMFGRVSLPLDEQDRIAIDAAAVRMIGQLNLVDVVLPDGAVERRFVRVGDLLTDAKGRRMIEIVSGLQVGEKVLLTPAGVPESKQA